MSPEFWQIFWFSHKDPNHSEFRFSIFAIFRTRFSRSFRYWPSVIQCCHGSTIQCRILARCIAAKRQIRSGNSLFRVRDFADVVAIFLRLLLSLLSTTTSDSRALLLRPGQPITQERWPTLPLRFANRPKFQPKFICHKSLNRNRPICSISRNLLLLWNLTNKWALFQSI